MTSDNRQRRPFSLREYADRYCDGLLSAAQTAELERRLRDDPPALDEFVLYMEIHSRIAWNIRAGGAERRLPADSPAIDFPAGAAVDYPAVGAAVCPPCRTAADAAAPALPTIVLSDASHPTPFVGGFAFSYMVATVFMCLLLLGFWAYKLPSDRGSSIAGSDNSRRSTTSGEESIRDRPAPVFVGRIIGIAGVKWSDDPKYLPPIGINVRLGQQYKLKSGLLEITYDSGAKVILEGPCSYEVDSTAGGYLALGKLVARVGAGDEGRGAGEAASGRWPVASMEDEGGRMKDEASLATSHSPLATNPSPLSPLPSPLFSVRTPTAVVTDLGTEFGMEVLAGGRTETVVFDGAVRVVVSDPMALNRVLECHAGQSVIVESVESGESGVRHVAAGEDAADRFVRVMLSPAARDSQTYANYVLSLDPVLYFQMTPPENGQAAKMVHDSAAGGRHGALRLGNEYGGSPYRTGRFGNALWLRGPEVGDYAIATDYPQAKDDRLTVSTWALATGRPGWAHIAANWSGKYGDQDFEGQFELALYRKEGTLCARVRQRDGKVVEVRDEEMFPLFKWQHVALVLDGETARLYRNGREVDSRACAGVLRNPPVSGLAIGCRLNRSGTGAIEDGAPGYEFWQGRIDELAVFHHALPEEAIRQLYDARFYTEEKRTEKGNEPKGSRQSEDD